VCGSLFFVYLRKHCVLEGVCVFWLVVLFDSIWSSYSVEKNILVGGVSYFVVESCVGD
jgi:hypothetical protein